MLSDDLSDLSDRWRKEADALDDEARRELNRIARYGFIGAATRMRRMADELDGVNAPLA